MKLLIFNSTPLIYLVKAGLSYVLEKLNEDKITTPLVKNEVVDKGKIKGVADAIILEKLFNNKIFKIIEPKDKEFTSRLMKTRGLHTTDAEVLSLTRELNGLAIVDDELARRVAKIYEIPYAGTPYILIRAILEKIVTKDKAVNAVTDMITVGWRCSIENYLKIIELLNKIN